MKATIFSAILLGSLSMTACGGGYGYAAHAVPAPPAPYAVGAVGYAPGPGYIWTDGFWDLRGSRWVWVNGRWVTPPRGRRAWVTDRWERHGNGWRFHRGYWR